MPDLCTGTIPHLRTIQILVIPAVLDTHTRTMEFLISPLSPWDAESFIPFEVGKIILELR